MEKLLTILECFKNIFFNNMLTSPLLSAVRKGGQVAVWRCRKIDTAASACNDE